MHNTQLHTGLPAFLKVLFIAKEKVLEKNILPRQKRKMTIYRYAQKCIVNSSTNKWIKKSVQFY